MTTVIVSIPSEIGDGLNSMMGRFGFESKQDFIITATRDKVLELKKQMFFELSSEVAQGLKKAGVEEQEILDDFEKTRNKE